MTDETPAAGPPPDEPVDWSARPGGGWREYVDARERMRRRLAEAAELRRLRELWALPCPFADPDGPAGAAGDGGEGA